jgi:hypothetical protein
VYTISEYVTGMRVSEMGGGRYDGKSSGE